MFSVVVAMQFNAYTNNVHSKGQTSLLTRTRCEPIILNLTN